MLPSNRRRAADKNDQGPTESPMFSSEEGRAGSTVRTLPSAKKEREATLLGLGVTDRLACDMKLEAARANAAFAATMRAEVRDPKGDRFDPMAETAEVSLNEMEVVRPHGENVGSALGGSPHLAAPAETHGKRPDWLKGDRSFTAAIVATALCTMLALVLITTSRAPERTPAKDAKKTQASSEPSLPVKTEPQATQEAGRAPPSADSSAAVSAPVVRASTVKKSASKKRFTKAVKPTRRKARISKE